MSGVDREKGLMVIKPSGVTYDNTQPEDMEEIAFMAWHTMMIDPGQGAMQQELLDKHYLRKHGKNAYYGQG